MGANRTRVIFHWNESESQSHENFVVKRSQQLHDDCEYIWNWIYTLHTPNSCRVHDFYAIALRISIWVQLTIQETYSRLSFSRPPKPIWIGADFSMCFTHKTYKKRSKSMQIGRLGKRVFKKNYFFPGEFTFFLENSRFFWEFHVFSGKFTFLLFKIHIFTREFHAEWLK